MGGGLSAHGLRIPRSFFQRPAQEVAPDLLGRVVVAESGAGPVAVRLTEVEAYGGEGEDPASHAHRGRTPRTEVMFETAGHLYVYFSYGMHWCTNIVCGARGTAAAVLLRAGAVVAGVDLAQARRPRARGVVDLARGPAKLTAVLGVSGADDGLDLAGRRAWVRLHEGAPPPPTTVRTGPRVGISQATELAWRFWLADEPTVSRGR